MELDAEPGVVPCIWGGRVWCLTCVSRDLTVLTAVARVYVQAIVDVEVLPHHLGLEAIVACLFHDR